MTDLLQLAAKGAQALKAGDVTEAKDIFAKLCEQDANSQLWPSLLARAHLAEGGAQEAFEISDKALHGRDAVDVHSSKDSELLLARGRARLGLGRQDKSREDLDRASSLGGLGNDAKQELAEAFVKLGAEVPVPKTASVPIIERRQVGNELLQFGAKATQAWKAGDLAQAHEMFSKICEQDGKSPLWPLCLARVCLDEGKASEAFDVSHRALQGRDPAQVHSSRDSELLLARGRANVHMGNSDKAQCDLERASALGGLGKDSRRELSEAFGKLGLSMPEAKTAVVPKSLPPPRPQVLPSKPKPAPEQNAAQENTKHLQSLPTGKLASDPSVASEKKAVPAAKASASTTAPPAAVELAKKAYEHEKKNDFIHAREQCQLALGVHPGYPSVVLCLARMVLRSGGSADEISKLFKKEAPKITTSSPWNIEALSIRAAASEDAEEWDDAAEDLEKAVAAAQGFQASGRKHDGPVTADLVGRLARAKYNSNDKEGGVALAQRCLDTGAETQREASEVACAVLIDQKGDVSTAISLMLRTLIAHRNAPSKDNAPLVCGVMQRVGVDNLLKVLAPKFVEGGLETVDEATRNSVAEVLGYVGLIMKERSEILQACRLYRLSVTFGPIHPSLCLNMMHTYSLRQDFVRALACGVKFFQRLKGKLSAAFIVCSLMCEPGRAQLRSNAAFHDGEFDNKGSFYDTLAIGFTIVKLLFLVQPFRKATDQELDDSAGSCQPQWQTLLMEKALPEFEQEKGTAASSTHVLRCEWSSDGDSASAHRNVLKGLCQVLDQSRQGHDLHMTPIRNEQAYFACVNDIINAAPNELQIAPDTSIGNPIYVVGDSHVCSNGWQTVLLPCDGEGDKLTPHQLVPCLVTGVKLWHLRKKSSFYTKFCFWDRIASIPSGSPVIISLGEIDCREGILKSVYMCRHKSVEAALSAIIDIYLTVLKEVRRKLPKNPLFIHPVANVIPDTRFLTMPFNALLQKRGDEFEKVGAKLLQIESIFQDGVELSPTASSEDLQKLKLLPGLELDGTHMNPTYVKSHLNPALASVWQ